MPDLSLTTFVHEEDNYNIHELILLTKARDDWESPEIEPVSDYSWHSPIELSTDDDVHVSVAVKNYDAGEAAGPFTTSFLVDGVELVSIVYDRELQENGLTPLTFLNLGRMFAGEHILTVVVDSRNTVEESNEDNNVFTLSFTVAYGDSIPDSYLLSSDWRQDGDGINIYNYNKYTPEEYLTGCVPLAMGQILYYWAQMGYAVSLTVNDNDFFNCTVNGAAAFTVTAGTNLQEKCGISLAQLNDLLASITYDEPNWDGDDDIAALTLAGMLIGNSTANKKVTGEKVKYDFTSTAFNVKILQRANFNATKIETFTDATWNTIAENVLAGMPVVISSNALQHAFIVDGYNAQTGEFHLNFGWGGNSTKGDVYYDTGLVVGNGWYTTAEMAVYDFTGAIVGITPNYHKTVENGAIVDGSYLAPTMEEDAMQLVLLDKEMTVPVSLDKDNLKLCVIGNAPDERNVAFLKDNAIVMQPAIKGFVTEDNPPVAMTALNDGVSDVFLARANGTWDKSFYAENMGYVSNNTKVDGLDEIAFMDGRNKICDVFFGSNDANVLLLTNDACGDALFLEDIYSDTANASSNSARLGHINEIYAGAGNDVVDLTSDLIEYQGQGMVIHGCEGDDVIWANKGSNILFGDAGNDQLIGTRNNDEIFVGGTGNDEMQGISGNNVFCFGSGWGNDMVLVQPEGSATLVFLDGLAGYNWNEESYVFTCGSNSVTVDKMTQNLTIYVGAECIRGELAINYEDYSAYCAARDSSIKIYG